MNHTQIKDTHYPLLREVIPTIISDHLEEMDSSAEFNLFIQQNPEYKKELTETFYTQCEALFYNEEEFQRCLGESKTEGYQCGTRFAEINYFTVEMILKLTNSTRMCCLRRVLRVLDGITPKANYTLILERLFELANIRQNSFYHGYINKQNEKLKIQTITDPLTGLYNRRYFYECIGEEISAAYKGSYPITLMLIDLNNFKAINDEFGHKEGDNLLKQFSTIIMNTRSHFDNVFRFGGDEFVMVFPNCNEENAIEIGKRLNRKLSQSTPKVSFSFGVVGLPVVQNSEKVKVDHFIKIADERMYENKYKLKELN